MISDVNLKEKLEVKVLNINNINIKKEENKEVTDDKISESSLTQKYKDKENEPNFNGILELISTNSNKLINLYCKIQENSKENDNTNKIEKNNKLPFFDRDNESK